jgi:hypothetical protein
LIAVYDEAQRDTSNMPALVSQDAHCTVVNTGGWVNLHADQTFVVSLDNTNTVCDTAGYHLPTSIFRRGTYLQRDTVILMTLDGSRGPDITAVLQNLGGGYYPRLVFHFAGHDYLMLNHESQAFVRARE